MKKLLIFIFIFYAFFNTASANSIKGAFGYELGEIVESIENKYYLTQISSRKAIQIGNKTFKPDKPLPFLDKYQIFTSPTSKIIYEIRAEKSTMDSEPTDKENCGKYDTDLSTLLEMLEARYGKFKELKNTHRDGFIKGVYWYSEQKVFDVKDNYRNIIVKCFIDTKTPPVYLLSLRYLDVGKQTTASYEGLEIERQKVLNSTSEYDL